MKYKNLKFFYLNGLFMDTLDWTELVFLLPQDWLRRRSLPVEECRIRAAGPAAPPALRPGSLLWFGQFVTSQPSWSGWWAAWSRWSRCCSRCITGSCCIRLLSTGPKPSASWRRWDTPDPKGDVTLWIINIHVRLVLVLDSGQSAATLRPGRALCRWTRNQEALLLQEEVSPGPAEAVSSSLGFI